MNEIKKVERTIQGRVVSDKMQKTITVAIERRVRHALYGKYITRTSKIKAHDEANAAKTGDLVLLTQTRPVAKNKAWKLVQVLESVQVIAEAAV
ncbi:MAG: 30S ribosomal protein S17 [Nevskiales bacterium]